MKRYFLLFLIILYWEASMAQCPSNLSASVPSKICANGPATWVTTSLSQVGVSYQLRLNGVNYGPAVAGTGTFLSWSVTQAGTYSIQCTYVSSGCTTMASWPGGSTLTVIRTPTTFALSGGGNICAGQTTSITLAWSEPNTTYNLLRNNSFVSGSSRQPMDGSSVTWQNLSLAGGYTVEAYPTGESACRTTMGVQINITVTQPPTSFSLSLNSAVACPDGGTPSTISTSDSDSGVIYELMRNGIVAGRTTGTGSALSWQSSLPGTYTALARSSNNICFLDATNTVTMTLMAPPTNFQLTGGGYTCTANPAEVTLSGSEVGAKYSLANYAGASRTGDGQPIIWSDILTAGNYFVTAQKTVDNKTCSFTLSDIVNVQKLSTFSVSGSATICPQSAGRIVSVNNSQVGIQYQLLRNDLDEGPPKSGTGIALQWPGILDAGTYKVKAIDEPSGCFQLMNSAAFLTPDPFLYYPVVKQSTGPLCGQTSVKLMGKQSGVDYKLKRDQTHTKLLPVVAGSSQTWSALYASGRYTVEGFHTSSGCTVDMPGSVDLACDFDNFYALENLAVSTDSVPDEYLLAVGGKILTAGINLKVPELWPDYVFRKYHPILSLDEVNNFIRENAHLPNMLSAEQMQKKAYSVSAMDMKLLEKIEELTLYAIELNEQLSVLKELPPASALRTRHSNENPSPSNTNLHEIHSAQGDQLSHELSESNVSTAAQLQVAQAVHGTSETFQSTVRIAQSLGIGSERPVPQEFKLMVEGNIIAAGIDIKAPEDWPDYVFSNDYDLMPIQSVKEFIASHGHLPDVPSAAEMTRQRNYDIGEIDKDLLEKIEELTLYMIRLKCALSDASGNKLHKIPEGTLNGPEIGGESSNSEDHGWDRTLGSDDDDHKLSPLPGIMLSDMEKVTVIESVSIGTTRTVPNYKLVVAGNILAEGARILPPDKWPDYVFHRGYKLMRLPDLKDFIAQKGHLPNFKSAAEMVIIGDYNIAEMDAKLLEKIEELMLYVIDLDEAIDKAKMVK